MLSNASSVENRSSRCIVGLGEVLWDICQVNTDWVEQPRIFL